MCRIKLNLKSHHLSVRSVCPATTATPAEHAVQGHFAQYTEGQSTCSSSTRHGRALFSYRARSESGESGGGNYQATIFIKILPL